METMVKTGGLQGWLASLSSTENQCQTQTKPNQIKTQNRISLNTASSPESRLPVTEVVCGASPLGQLAALHGGEVGGASL